MNVSITKKHNWWTPIKDKKNVSESTKILYILEKGSIDELKNVIANFGVKKLENVFKKSVLKNIFISDKRKKFLLFFFKLYE